ncbi:MAG TPA: hypothetical protein VE136_00490 [Anaerolineales bacterium]|nr:hypothetical protein [Anaerolineales bacterium]
MPTTVVLHVQNAEPILCEVDELPGPGDQSIKVKNPRRIDGKDLNYLAENVQTVIWPLDKLNFIEVLASEEEEKIIGFVRE